MTKQTRNTLLLVCGALIWGLAFTAQSLGAGMGAYAFLFGRSWLAVAFLLVLVAVFDAVNRRAGRPYGWPKARQEKRDLWLDGFLCGTMLFFASATQQIGINMNPSTAKASFITAMYVVLVPLVGLLLGRRAGPQIWLCVALAVGGLYLLCMKNGFGRLEASDCMLLLCALLFTFQIMLVARYSPRVDGVRLSFVQFLTVSVWSTVFMLLFETPTAADFAANVWPILFCGILSSGVAYTLQIVGQNGLNPTIASLAMCLESVFGALGGWVILHQVLSLREIAGCALIFTAVVLAQLPAEALARRKADKTA